MSIACSTAYLESSKLTAMYAIRKLEKKYLNKSE